MGTNTVTLNEANFQASVIQSKQPVLVDFWAEWCGPCKMIAPTLDELATEYLGKLVVGKVDVDSNQNLAVQYGIQGIPTLLLFKDGRVVDKIVGLKSKRDLKASMDRSLA